MIPRAQTSIDGFAGAFLVKTSGDMYLGDPASVGSLLAYVHIPAIPKSQTLITFESTSVIIIFSNFKSLCIIFSK